MVKFKRLLTDVVCFKCFLKTVKDEASIIKYVRLSWFWLACERTLNSRISSLQTSTDQWRRKQAGMAAAIPIWNLVWRRHTNLLKFGQLIFRKII